MQTTREKEYDQVKNLEYTPSATDVKALREATNAPVMDCRRALAESAGDFDKAKKLIAERGQQIAAKKADKATSEGFICRARPTSSPATSSSKSWRTTWPCTFAPLGRCM